MNKIIEAIDKLTIENLDYELKNNNIHIIVTDLQGHKIDFYPTTGTWTPRGGTKSSGLNNLIRYIKSKDNL